MSNPLVAVDRHNSDTPEALKAAYRFLIVVYNPDAFYDADPDNPQDMAAMENAADIYARLASLYSENLNQPTV